MPTDVNREFVGGLIAISVKAFGIAFATAIATIGVSIGLTLIEVRQPLSGFVIPGRLFAVGRGSHPAACVRNHNACRADLRGSAQTGFPRGDGRGADDALAPVRLGAWRRSSQHRGRAIGPAARADMYGLLNKAGRSSWTGLCPAGARYGRWVALMSALPRP